MYIRDFSVADYSAIADARSKGYPTLLSSTGAVNQAMQHIFTRLGYQRLPVWHQLQKDVQ